MIDLYSPLTVQECLRRLEQRADPPWSLLGRKALIGGISKSRFFARKRLPMLVHNSFQPRLTAKLEPEGSGAVLHCSFGLHPFVSVFMIFWFAGVILIGGGLAISSAAQLASGAAQADAWFGVLIPLAMIIFGLFLTAGGWWLASGDKAFIISAVRRAVDVEDERISLQG